MITDEQIDQRFKWLLFCTAGILLLTVVLSIFQFGAPPRVPRMKVGFILLGTKDTAGWNHSQYVGINEACKNLHMELLLRENVPEHTEACQAAVKELAGKGCKIIFLPSYGYLQDVHDFIRKHPEITFCTNATGAQEKNITAYAIRMYEARYLAGILAGRETKSGVIGYIAALSNPEVNRGINAFALGVQSVNPQARVKVVWINSWSDAAKEKAAVEQLAAAKADILTYHVDGHAVARAAADKGIDFIGFHEALEGYAGHNLTSVVCNWSSGYLDVLQRFSRGELGDTPFYWKGVGQDMTGLTAYAQRVPPALQAEIEENRRAILAGKNIFSGVLYDQQGILRCQAGEVIPDHVLMEHMDWLVKGVDVLAK